MTASQATCSPGWLLSLEASTLSIVAWLGDMGSRRAVTTLRGRDFLLQGRNVLGRAAILTLGLVGLASCSPAASQSQSAGSLRPDESARLAELEAVAEYVRVAYGAGCVTRPCAPEFVIANDLEAAAMWDGPSFRVWLQRRALAPGAEPRPAVAHELSHWLLGHTRHDCAEHMFDCETAANAEAVRVLVVGWGVTTEEAVSLMYRSLVGALRNGNPPRGHDDPCKEVLAFAERFGRPPPMCTLRSAPKGQGE